MLEVGEGRPAAFSQRAALGGHSEAHSPFGPGVLGLRGCHVATKLARPDIPFPTDQQLPKLSLLQQRWGWDRMGSSITAATCYKDGCAGQPLFCWTVAPEATPFVVAVGTVGEQLHHPHHHCRFLLRLLLPSPAATAAVTPFSPSSVAAVSPKGWPPSTAMRKRKKEKEKGRERKLCYYF